MHHTTVHQKTCLPFFPTYIIALPVSAALHHSSLRSITHRLCAQQASTGRFGPLPSLSCGRCRTCTTNVVGPGPNASGKACPIVMLAWGRLRQVKCWTIFLTGHCCVPVRPLRTIHDLRSWCEKNVESRTRHLSLWYSGLGLARALVRLDSLHFISVSCVTTPPAAP